MFNINDDKEKKKKRLHTKIHDYFADVYIYTSNDDTLKSSLKSEERKFQS
jgi:hypothetical protein